MAGNPQIAQGTLNRLRASVTVANIPALNVTAPFLGREGISLNPEGPVTTMIPTQTGFVASPEPFQQVTVTMHLLRTQGLSALYKEKVETNSFLGDVVIRPDSVTLPDYSLSNCSIVAVRELGMNGSDAGYVVSISGIYHINNDLWSA